MKASAPAAIHQVREGNQGMRTGIHSWPRRCGLRRETMLPAAVSPWSVVAQRFTNRITVATASQRPPSTQCSLR